MSIASMQIILNLNSVTVTPSEISVFSTNTKEYVYWPILVVFASLRNGGSQTRYIAKYFWSLASLNAKKLLLILLSGYSRRKIDFLFYTTEKPNRCLKLTSTFVKHGKGPLKEIEKRLVPSIVEYN